MLETTATLPETEKSVPTPTKPLTMVACLPGDNFSGRFVDCLLDTTATCLARGVRLRMSRRSSCNIYYVRNLCLGGDVGRGPGQKPFDGKIDYDYLLWIDSDIVFHPNQIFRLLSHQSDIVSGLYLMEGGRQFATVKDWDEAFFEKHGYFQFLTPADLTDQFRLMEVAYTGLGFMLVKRGVFESLEYPWFRPIEKRIGPMVEFTMEDVAFCLRAREKGFKILIDPQVRVGHEKRVVLS